MLTHIVRHIFRTAKSTNFKLGKRMEDNDTHQPQAPWLPRSKVKVISTSLSRVGPMAYKSKTNSRSITKIGRPKNPTTRATLRISF